MRGRRMGGRTASPKPDATGLAALADAFLEHLAARAYSQGSIDVHRWALREFTAWAADAGHHDPGALTRAGIEAYQLHLHHYCSPRTGRPLGVNTQLGRLGCVRRFFAWLCRSGVIPANPAADLDLPRKQARRLPKTLAPDELARLLALPDPADPFGLRDRAILELFYAAGLRRSEMAHLDAGDYDPAARALMVRRGKGGKSRLVPVGERAAAWLDRYLTESRPLFDHLPSETALFLTGYGARFRPASLGNRIAKLLKACGISKAGCTHLFRHTCATDMHHGGADVRHVQEMLGHARLETTQIYTHLDIQALAEVHARTHPHGRIPPGHDMYGALPSTADSPPCPVEPEEPAEPAAPEALDPPAPDSPSHPAGDLIEAGSVMLAAATAPAGLAGGSSGRVGSCHPQDPASPPSPGPEEDPPSAAAPLRPPPPSGPPEGRYCRNPLHFNPLEKVPPPAPTMGVRVYGYRDYDPPTGRWPSRDPIDGMGGLNIYAFVANDGLNEFDGLGLAAFALLVSGPDGANDAQLIANRDGLNVRIKTGKENFDAMLTVFETRHSRAIRRAVLSSHR